MQKLFRLFALSSILAFSVAPTLTAETMGTNPKPRPAIPKSTVIEALQQFVFVYFGL